MLYIKHTQLQTHLATKQKGRKKWQHSAPPPPPPPPPSLESRESSDLRLRIITLVSDNYKLTGVYILYVLKARQS